MNICTHKKILHPFHFRFREVDILHWERRFLAKVLKHPCKGKACPLKKGNDDEREKVPLVS